MSSKSFRVPVSEETYQCFATIDTIPFMPRDTGSSLFQFLGTALANGDIDQTGLRVGADERLLSELFFLT
jgi:hypothetical protein